MKERNKILIWLDGVPNPITLSFNDNFKNPDEIKKFLSSIMLPNKDSGGKDELKYVFTGNDYLTFHYKDLKAVVFQINKEVVKLDLDDMDIEHTTPVVKEEQVKKVSSKPKELEVIVPSESVETIQEATITPETDINKLYKINLPETNKVKLAPGEELIGRNQLTAQQKLELQQVANFTPVEIPKEVDLDIPTEKSESLKMKVIEDVFLE